MPADSLDAVRVGEVTIVPDATRPVAAIVAADSTVGWVAWPDAPMPPRAIGEARLWPTSTGAWLVYTAEDDDDPELCRQSSAVFITAQGVGAACDLGVGQLVGVDDGGLWVGESSPATLRSGPDARGGLPPGRPLPTPATDLVRVHTDGTRSVIVVDHLVHRAALAGTRLMVQFYPTGPRKELDLQHAGWTIVHEAREVDLDAGDGLPPRIDTDELASRPVLEDDDEESWEADLGRQRHAVDAWTDRLELNGVDGIEWPLAPVTEEARNSSITRIRARFEGLGDPYLLWTSDDHVVRRSPSDYRAVEVTESGEWPGTEIIVSFEHCRVHDLRLRRRYRVFDDAGRPRTWAYATVHLEEDIATGAVPPRSAAVDGVLEI
ncbi:hypothetical protein [uncultured Arthrobacter sp.]|uniref:hypothetical protein n=1 Tax=uncultured Arthrobacter sp. TaxID=114050 RepID=UPI002613617F|nr:hypothetical protein [uncultured Arthrobacter sp.]